ncbi:TonB-dependent receptor [uncultured Paraglaciecola sp.]|uniref:TonB-dependent receptor n=1 Tax=uncultured Paraglaciecola sp. TaxID=1765024 RepID=UPI002632ACA7|nr:TonB-dependent receptor plug domain-containing protein [uncultured Paraglaciecola sp.]
MIFNRKPLTSIISLLLASPVLLAQENTDLQQIERITVQGALVSTPLSEMATSISVLTKQVIEQRQAQHLEELLNRAANVNFATGASRGRFVQIRGIGERSQFTDPVNPSVGYLVDGINYSGLMAGASTFDVQQVEIFKGPNSARFGADGLAGMINVITQDASDDTSVNAQFGVANYNSWHLGAAVGGELVESVDFRLSVHQNNSDGFIENTFLGRKDTNDVDELTIRAKLNWQATDDLSIKSVLHLIDVDNGYDGFSLDRDRTTLSDEPGVDRQDSDAWAVTADYQGLAWANVQLQGSFMEADLSYGFDEDWSYDGISPGWEYSSTDYYFRDREDVSIQGKLSSKNDAANTWVVGFYFADSTEDLTREYSYLDAPFKSDVERLDRALFAQYKFVLSDDQWLTSSLRLASQTFRYDDSNLLDKKVEHDDWGAELSYHQNVSDTSMLYLSLVRSYKMGGVNGQALGKIDDIESQSLRDALLDSAEFDAESLLGLEFGIKGSNNDGSLTVDFSTFYQKRDDVQFKNSIVEGQSFIDSINNAADGKNYGIEASLNYLATDDIVLFANLGYLKTQVTGFTRQDGSNIDKREQAHAPKYHLNLGINMDITENLSWLVEVDAKDEFYYSYSHDNRSDAMAIAHASIDYTINNWRISLYARNLFDEDYANRGFYFGNDPRDEYAPHVWEQFGEPRRIGLNFKYQY